MNFSEDNREKIIEEVINELLREGYNIREISEQLKEEEEIALQKNQIHLNDVLSIPQESLTV